MKQECTVWAVWLTWLGLPALALILGVYRGWYAGLLVLLVGVLATVAYIRWFPRISRWMGYGSVADVAPGSLPKGACVPRVTLYSAKVCPFCPLVRARLGDLQNKLGFELEEIDLTFRPELVRTKGVRSVPAVEAAGRTLTGNATSEELARFLAEG